MNYMLNHLLALLKSKRTWSILAGVAAHYAVNHGWVGDLGSAQAYAEQLIDYGTGAAVLLSKVWDNHQAAKAAAPKQ